MCHQSVGQNVFFIGLAIEWGTKKYVCQELLFKYILITILEHLNVNNLLQIKQKIETRTNKLMQEKEDK